MALKIEQSCINCEMCELECPNQAISLGDPVFVIDPSRCTECVGHYDKPTCVSVCPIDCIVTDPDHDESLQQLADKFVALTGAVVSH